MTVLVAAVGVIAAAAIIVPQLFYSRDAAEDLTATPSIEPTSSPTAGDSAPGSTADMGSEVALRCFLDARLQRDFEAAKECMTARLIDNYSDPVEFIGPSSPNIQRFTILADVGSITGSGAAPAESLTGNVVSVRAYTGSSTGLISYSDYEVDVIRVGGRWLVDRWDRGEERPLRSTTEVVVYLPPTEALCKDLDASDLVAVRREVLETHNQALAAVQELLMGPSPSDSAYGSFFPLGSRVLEVRLDESGGEVRLNETATLGIPCVRAMNRAAMDMTLRPYIDPDKLDVSPKL